MSVEHRAPPAAQPEGFRPHAGLLAECRDLIKKRACEALSKAIREIDEELQERRRDLGATEESLRLLEAQYQLRAAGAELDRKFAAAFDQQFTQRAKPLAKKSSIYGTEGGFLETLSLVADEEITETLTVQNLANRLQQRCESELQELEPRVAFMLGQEEIDSTANPVGPAAICESIKELCWTLDGSRETRELLLEMMVRRLGSELAGVFQEANSLLVSRKVLPNVRTRARPRSLVPGPQSDPRSAAAGSDLPPETQELVQRLFAPRADAPPLQPNWATQSGGAELMQMLTRLQTGESGVTFGEDAFSIDPAAAATGNVLRSLVGAGLSKHVGSVEGIVIDVVATLFDYIFDDDRVPEAMKGLIGRLQIPVLKLAIMDHAFFSNRTHPARRLINALAQAAATWDGELDTDSPLYHTAERIVLRIQNQFAEEPEVFVACLQELEDHLAEQERRADERAAGLAGRLEQRERQELARSVAQDAVSLHAANDAIPPAVRGFIAGPWLKVLMRASLAGGEDGAAWREATSAMDDLAWSVAPKLDSEARQRLVERLPQLIRTLKTGAEVAGMEPADRDAFFSELVKLHAAAIKAGTSSAPAPQAPSPSAQAPGVEGTSLPPDAPEPQPTWDAPDASELELLERGSWIELEDETGSVRRMRLTWISPARTMYLFANRQGQRALALTRRELGRRFAAGEARVPDEAALLDRIVDDVLENYQAQG